MVAKYKLEDYNGFYERYEQGMSIHEIAKQIGVSKNTVSENFKILGLRIRTKLEQLTNNNPNFRHGHCSKGYTSEYNTWIHVKNRCSNPGYKEFHLYGGRGISVCERWINSFPNFISDMGLKPSKTHSLDRFPDMNGNYDPNNCRWATLKEQNENKRNNVWIEFNGERKIKSEWCRILKTQCTHLDVVVKRLGSFESAYNHYMNKQLNNK